MKSKKQEVRYVSIFAPVRKNEKDEWEVFLQRRAKDAARNPDNYGFFGGGIDVGESPEEALIREIKEELTYTIRFFKPFGKREFPGSTAFRYFGPVEKDFETLIDVKEGQYGKWFTKKAIAAEHNVHQYTRENIKDLFEKLSGIKELLSNDDFYASLPRKRVGASMLLNSADKVLLVKPVYKTTWQIPGGVTDEFESPEKTAERELFEEVGLKRKSKGLLVAQFRHDGGSKESMQFIFYGGTLKESGVKKLKLQEEELSHAKLVPLSEAKKMLPAPIFSRLNRALKRLKNPKLEPFEDYIG